MNTKVKLCLRCGARPPRRGGFAVGTAVGPSSTTATAESSSARHGAHVHPNGNPGDGRTPAGPEVRSVADVPSIGAYRLFLDFQHDGVVRTAEFTVPTGATAAASAPDTTVDGDAADGHGP